jgi:hypothetical protein
MPNSQRTNRVRAADRPAGARRRARAALAAAFLIAACAMATIVSVAAGSSPEALEGKISASQAREGEVRSGIGADTHQIAGFQGNI